MTGSRVAISTAIGTHRRTQTARHFTHMAPFPSSSMRVPGRTGRRRRPRSQVRSSTRSAGGDAATRFDRARRGAQRAGSGAFGAGRNHCRVTSGHVNRHRSGKYTRFGNQRRDAVTSCPSSRHQADRVFAEQSASGAGVLRSDPDRFKSALLRSETDGILWPSSRHGGPRAGSANSCQRGPGACCATHQGPSEEAFSVYPGSCGVLPQVMKPDRQLKVRPAHSSLRAARGAGRRPVQGAAGGRLEDGCAL